ncbi:uncharacterized protein MEPE_06106 [Melanopsichium pennsylvanicum]|uniref:Uncharacterized protein n=1 Tax=Melanopsichium pennsylvanicum TaxID=63383 RepID=A0AAJ4XT21_9BASI|nr:uncharacterized protein MEPE_06106 [Melanopsichium pennsylvanicum]
MSYFNVTLVFILLLSSLSSRCSATEVGESSMNEQTAPSSSADSFQPFRNKLYGGRYLESSSEIHSHLDLRGNRLSHRLLPHYLFNQGRNFDPKVIYLGPDPEDSSTHLAVNAFKPDKKLAESVVPSENKGLRWRNRHALLAMRFRFHE